MGAATLVEARLVPDPSPRPQGGEKNELEDTKGRANES